MNIVLKKFLPYFLILLGFFLLFIMSQAVSAGICFLIGVVMIINSMWPEKWDKDNI